jgi:hypothetical protein
MRRTPLDYARRRGSAYLLVLGGSLLLVTAGMGAIYASGVRRAQGELQVEAWKARLAAEAGIECALDDINTDTNWRTVKSSGTWYTGRSTGDGAFTVSVTDLVDGNLANNLGDPVEVLAIGSAGRGISKLKVALNSTPTPASSLGAVLCSGGAQTITGTTVNSDQIIHSNAAITAVLSTVSGTASSVLTTAGLTFTGSALSLQPSRTIPTGSASRAYYVSAGNTINRALLPRSGGDYLLERCVISPASNPYGAANAMGIYVLDMSDEKLIIRNCRIVGTLVVLNAGGGSEIRGSVRMIPAVVNYPVLHWDGNISLDFNSGAPLSESALGVNFNPVGTPYQGVSDADTTDSYPSEIQGLVYIRGNITTSNSPKIVGNLMCTGAVTTSGTLTLNYAPTCFTAPPPGFVEMPVPMKVVPGTWQRLVD